MYGFTITGNLRITRIAAGALALLPRSGRRVFGTPFLRDLERVGLAMPLVEQPNMVVDLGLSAISRLVGFGLAAPDVTNGTDTFGVSDVDDLRISTMKFGNLNTPVAPTAADDDLEDPTPLTTVTPTASYPGNFEVRWSGVIPANAFTGSQVTEEALFLANGALFARTTFAPQALVAGFGLQFDHTFTLARA